MGILKVLKWSLIDFHKFKAVKRSTFCNSLDRGRTKS